MLCAHEQQHGSLAAAPPRLPGLPTNMGCICMAGCCTAALLHCAAALQVYLRRIRKYLGAYLVHLGGRVDAIVFSAGERGWRSWAPPFSPTALSVRQGIGEGSCCCRAPVLRSDLSQASNEHTNHTLSAGVGENGSMLRELALSGLEWAGIAVDRPANDATIRGRAGEVQAPGSRVKARAS